MHYGQDTSLCMTPLGLGESCTVRYPVNGYVWHHVVRLSSYGQLHTLVKRSRILEHPWCLRFIIVKSLID